jgi:hypothetical protein
VSRRRSQAVPPLQPRPPMPRRLGVYSPGDWEAPSDAPTDGDWHAWGTAHRRALAEFEASRSAWLVEYGHLPVSGDPVPDEPFDGSGI